MARDCLFFLRCLAEKTIIEMCVFYESKFHVLNVKVYRKQSRLQKSNMLFNFSCCKCLKVSTQSSSHERVMKELKSKKGSSLLVVAFLAFVFYISNSNLKCQTSINLKGLALWNWLCVYVGSVAY